MSTLTAADLSHERDFARALDAQDALASFDQARSELAVAEKALLAKLKAAGYA